jgi:hypothetical protein
MLPSPKVNVKEKIDKKKRRESLLDNSALERTVIA